VAHKIYDGSVTGMPDETFTLCPDAETDRPEFAGGGKRGPVTLLIDL
jgi:hypothetical protein